MTMTGGQFVILMELCKNFPGAAYEGISMVANSPYVLAFTKSCPPHGYNMDWVDFENFTFRGREYSVAHGIEEFANDPTILMNWLKLDPRPDAEMLDSIRKCVQGCEDCDE
jgi:hypothetical protein